MRILLIQPLDSRNVVGFGKFGCPEPLALEILGAGLPHHHAEILDMRIDSNLEGRIRDFGPKLVAVTGYTPNVPQMLDCCEKVKETDAEITTVVGGYHATLCPEHFDVEYLDVIVVGEGEKTLPELVTALEEDTDLGESAGVGTAFRFLQRTLRASGRCRPLKPLPNPLLSHRLDVSMLAWQAQSPKPDDRQTRLPL